MSKLAALHYDVPRALPAPHEALVARASGGAAATRMPPKARLIDALESNYPALAHLLGRTEFAALGRAYIEAHPLRFYSIRCYGDALPQLLASHPSYCDAPVLADLARWEWATTEAFDAAEAEPIDAGALAAVPPGRRAALRFDLHPSVRVLALSWNAPQIWEAVMVDAADPLPPAPELLDEPLQWLLWRQDLQIVFRPLSPLEAAALELCRRGVPFAELCERARLQVGRHEAVGRATALLNEWLSAGLIVRMRPNA